MIAATHLAQFEAIKAVLEDKGLTLENAKSNPDVAPELEVAAASAGR